MLRRCGIIFAGVFGLVIGLSAAGSHAQDAVLTEMYGSGVHAYFSDNLQQALNDLTAAIEAGSKDPRAYYFRGLVERRLGMEGNAEEDFARGAELEAKAADRFYPVSRSLERVQGSERLAIERHRAKARAIVYQLNIQREEQRYQRIQRAEEEVLRNVESAPLPAAAPTEVPAAAPKAAAPAENNLFSDPATEPAAADPFADEAPAEKAPGDEMPAKDDPFADDAPKAEAEEPAPAAEDKPEGDDPFGADAEEPAPEAEAADNDPFGAGGDDAAAEEKPAPAAEAEGDDPFGAAEEKPAAEDKPMAEEADDPFADDAPAEAPADDKPAEKEEMEEDPFG